MKMLKTEKDHWQLMDVEKPTDMEIAMLLMRLMEDSHGTKQSGGSMAWRDRILEMAGNVMDTMTNPCAKKLLEDNIIRQEAA
jgi:hypothetical protein